MRERLRRNCFPAQRLANASIVVQSRGRIQQDDIAIGDGKHDYGMDKCALRKTTNGFWSQN